MPLKASPLKLWRGRSFWTPKWDPPRKRLVTFVICNDFVKTFEKSETFGGEELGSPKVTLGSPTVSPFLYKCRRLRRNRGFFPVRHVKRYCKKNYFFFAIKNHCLPIGKRVVGLSNVMLWIAER